MNTQIMIAGFGGQGILFAGKFLAHCGMEENKNVSWLPSYGPEMRGGTANCAVCISDEAIASPIVTSPDFLICMNTPSFHKFIDTLPAGSTAFIDSTLIVEKSTRTDIECHYVEASKLALENDVDGTANIILIGKFLRETAMFSTAVAQRAFAECISKTKASLMEMNLKALKIGLEQ